VDWKIKCKKENPNTTDYQNLTISYLPSYSIFFFNLKNLHKTQWKPKKFKIKLLAPPIVEAILKIESKQNEPRSKS
jgi:hypothetical protein